MGPWGEAHTSFIVCIAVHNNHSVLGTTSSVYLFLQFVGIEAIKKQSGSSYEYPRAHVPGV